MRVSSLRAIVFSAYLLAWSRAAAAGQAPSAAEETRSPAGMPSTVEAPVRAGLIAGIGFPTAQRTIDALGRTVLPTVDLLRVGLLL